MHLDIMKLLNCFSHTPLRLVGRIALATAIAPFALAQDAAKPEGKMPPIKVDPTPLPQVAGTLTTFAPVVDKVAPSVVTISTSKMVKRGAGGGGGSEGGNPLNDPLFRRFFGIPDDDDNAAPAPNPRRGQGGRRGGNNNDDNSGAGEGKKHKQSIGLGSGVIVSAEGHILTNNHVIEGADEILVTIGNQKHEYKAKKIGTDPATDIAVLKIEATDLKPVVFADSDKLRVGDLAIAVGNPFGLTQSVTMGIISAVGRDTGITDFGNFIQTDASINPGNSGGALVDTEGRLVGINTAIFSRSGGNMGIGFAVPANLAHSVMEGIMKNGKVTRGFLGIGLQPVSEELAKQFGLGSTNGALVNEVQPKSAAEKAGIEAGDVVVGVNEKKINDPNELRLFVASFAPGTKVDVKVLRDGKEKSVSVTLGERPGQKIASTDEPAANEDPDVLDGVTVGDLDANARKQFEVPDNIKSGVVVTKVDPDSPSAEAGIKEGDVILEISKGTWADRKSVSSAKEAVELSEQLKKEKSVTLRVSTKGASRYVVVARKD
jgi:serine protease Do